MPPSQSQADIFLPNDRWCAVGDSITHQGQYLQTIYLYYLTRFPRRKLKLFNGGAGGDTAAGTLRRLDSDILVHKPSVATVTLGMNDIWWENGGLIGPNDYRRDLSRIVTRLQESHCRVIVCTTPPYDFSVKSGSDIDPKRQGLERYADQARTVASDYKSPLVDFFKSMTEITAREQSSNPSFSLQVADRTHPTPTGAFVMGYVFLKALGATAIVSSLNIDSNGGRALEHANCQIRNLTRKSDGISFSCLEDSLPFPTSAIPESGDRLVPFSQDLNQEILKVEGLTGHRYELAIDETPIGQFLGSTLARGIDLAVLSNTPQNKQANRLAEWNRQRTEIDGETLRYIAMMEYGELRKHYEVDDVNTPTQDIKALAEKEGGSPTEITRKFAHYLELKPEQGRSIEEVADYDRRIWENNRPNWHRYLIKKIDDSDVGTGKKG